MITTLRKAVDRMKAWRAFRGAMAEVREGAPLADVLSGVGPPDAARGPAPEAGIELLLEYHDRLPDHVDFIVAFSGGVVRCSFTRNVQDPQRRRELGCPYSP
jgi:hypothetical protein